MPARKTYQRRPGSYRRKPTHTKLRRSRSVVRRKQILRNSVELVSFKDFITETTRYRHTDDEYTLVHTKTQKFPHENENLVHKHFDTK